MSVTSMWTEMDMKERYDAFKKAEPFPHTEKAAFEEGFRCAVLVTCKWLHDNSLSGKPCVERQHFINEYLKALNL